MKQKQYTYALLVFLTLASSLLAAADEPNIFADKPLADAIYKNSDGIALKGYDPVAYFEKGKAEKGKKEFEHNWMEATWRFTSEANRDKFAQEPKKYVPQYGGYCAYGMAKGYAAPTDPTVWKIVEGKLYLNYNREVGKLWNQNIPEFITKADQNWPKIPKK